MFDEMIKIAKNKLVDDEKSIKEQITVLLSANNVIYITTDDMDGAICETLKRDNDTKSAKMITMWKDGAIDLSSFAFRSALLQLNQDNSDTEIILQGWDCYNTKKLSVTMPQ